MRIDYIDFFERVVPDWMRESNKKYKKLDLILKRIGNGQISQLL